MPLQLALEKRYSSNYSARVSYTWAKAFGNFGGDGIGSSDFQVGDNLNLELNERPTNVDRRHNLVVSWTALVPRTGGLTVSGIARYLSGLPFTLINNQFDEDRNGIQAEPLPAGTYRGNAAEDAYEVVFSGKPGGARGPTYFKLDMRLGYRFNVSGRTLEVFGDVFNVTNKANFATPSGNHGVDEPGDVPQPAGHAAGQLQPALDPARRAVRILIEQKLEAEPELFLRAGRVARPFFCSDFQLRSCDS